MDPCEMDLCEMDPCKIAPCEITYLQKCLFAKMILCQNAHLQEIACKNSLARCPCANM